MKTNSMTNTFSKTRNRGSKRLTILSVVLSVMLGVCSSCSGSNGSKDSEDNAANQTNVSQVAQANGANGSSTVTDDQNSNAKAVEGKNALKLTKTFSNADFCIDYPEEWEIISQGVTNDWNVTTVVNISEPELRDGQYTPNLRVLTVPEKVTDSTRQMAEGAWNQVQREGYYVELLEICDGLLNGQLCTILEYVIEKEYGPMRVQQVMFKKADDTSYSVVAQTNFDNPDELYTITDMLGTFRLK